MDGKSLMFLVNPAAGRSTSAAALGAVIEAFCTAGYHPTVFFTNRQTTLLARENAADYGTLVCLGGDGTLSQTISGLMDVPEEDRPMLGYIPMGTANDVANTLNLPLRRPMAAAQDVLNGRPMSYDVGLLNGEDYFTYVAAFGAFTEVSYATDQEMKNALGKAAYLLSGLSRLPKLKSYHTRVEYEDGVIEDDFIFGAVSNSTSVAGMIKLDKNFVALADGKFELVLVRTPKSVSELTGIVNGLLNQNYNGGVMQILQTSRVKFFFEEAVPWTRDGEDGGAHPFCEITNVPHAVKLIV